MPYNAKAGIIKGSNKIRSKEAARRVRQTIPNYAYVSDFVKGSRRSPLVTS